jgi:hypothetical protein
MDKHTPGPWDAHGTMVLQRGGVELHIAYCRQADDTPLTQNAEANARLIAAAPTLLDALQKIGGGFINSDFVMSNPPDWHKAFAELQEIARTALSAAAGREP